MTGSEYFSVAKVLCECEIFYFLEDKHQNLVSSILQLISAIFDFPNLESDDSRLFTVITTYRMRLLEVAKDSPYDLQYLNRTWSGFNLNFPNNSSLDSIPNQIKYLGSLEITDTSIVWCFCTYLFTV